MSKDSSASTRKPHANRTTRTATIMKALKHRARAVLKDESIDPRSRAILRDALRKNDPWLAKLVLRADVDENIDDAVEFSQTPEPNEANSTDKIEALAEIIYGGGAESAAALFVLMGAFQTSEDPKALANTLKHFAFTRCGELNLFGIVDDQIAVVERELLTRNSRVSS